MTQYNVQKAQWDELTGTCKRESCDLKVRNMPDGRVRLNVHGDDLEKVGLLKVRAEQLARGTTFSMWNRRLFDSATAQKLTDDLRDATGALVMVDKRIKGLRAYGPARAVERAREQLEFYAEELARKEYMKELTAQRTIQFFTEIGYPQLKETYGDDAVMLDLVSQPRKITVTGDEEIRHRLDRLFADSFGDWSSTKAVSDNEHTCPICMSPATAPSALGCGHVYCTECLTHFVRSALESNAFPLRCSGDEGQCGAPLLLEAAFHAHIEQNPNILRPCKTPGCAQLYSRSTREDGSATVKCPACFSSACAACGNNAHGGRTCAAAARDPSEDYINSHTSGIRRCPRCQTPIFKDGGCQHISCRCGVHICWRCLATFSTDRECYTHMSSAHGGIYEQEMDIAERRGHVEPAIPAEFIAEDRLARLQAREIEAVRPRGVAAELQRQRQQLADRRYQEDAEVQRRLRQLDATRRERERAEAERARQQQRGGWCVVM
ncbi:uncharacterized protein PHACADRAFT_154191 [Phanerochaete carnosa HHB-10118-sp]|uniref:RBR-type E3 ubiquitin transferase n=1 Tax=Phanerochaete carnosa (strain HHB-10118-sp) TaxID=650164 RepID=K5VSD4_PHACS|nr:uncharacterized protein PHACADRAFT_154191 [Phanerochaete carnosa HHB-10118-sp]EKM49685.1 hypothetical protein PHACADRAFT_154191 [Phanerochaete carnosa HHB-10118-sp]